MIEIKHATHLGKPTIFFTTKDYFVRPQMDTYILVSSIEGRPQWRRLKKAFISQFHLTGHVKIAYFDSKHIYLDFVNDIYYNHIF